ncbi:P-loop containing nucleoside triphosphate hydrolase protein, partial [Collybia nuda]
MEQPSPYEFMRKGEGLKRDEFTIALLGATGSGKSTFINLLTGSNLRVSSSLQSCTQKVSMTENFKLGDYTYRFIDTPGFDDTDRSEVEILKLIAKFLGYQYKIGTKIHGILYLYRISDNRMTGASRRSFRLFRKLCGDTSLKNVTIVTTMWNKVTELEGARRETELMGDERFFKLAIDEGATMSPHHGTLSSALRIINTISENHQRPIPLMIQTELVNQHKQIVDTDAGRELEHDLQERSHKYMCDLQDVMAEQLTADDDTKERNELAEEIVKLRMELTHVKNELSNLRVRAGENFDVEKAWKCMTQEARVITMFMRSQGGGAQQSPENLRFWSALGDTTKVAVKLSSIFDKNPMHSSLQNDLFNHGGNKFDAPTRHELGQWIRSQKNDVKSMEGIMAKVVRTASKRKGQRRWVF